MKVQCHKVTDVSEEHFFEVEDEYENNNDNA